MTEAEIKNLIAANLQDAEIHVEGDGYHFVATVISSAFTDLTTVKRQQTVYACVNAQIASGDIHALTIKAYTPAEWQQHEEN